MSETLEQRIDRIQREGFSQEDRDRMAVITERFKARVRSMFPKADSKES